MLQYKFHCKRFFFLFLNTPHTYCCCTSSIVKDFFFSFSKHTTHVLLLHKFHYKRFFFFSLSLNTPHTYTSSPQLPQLSSLNVISTLKYKIKLFFSSNSTGCYSSIQSIVQQYKIFFLSLPQFPQASTLFLYSSISPLFSFGNLSLAALKNSFSRTSFEQKKSLLFCALF
jgi:hypothetical protein